MTPHELAAKWQKAQLTERAGYQQHFLDLCDLLGQTTPVAAWVGTGITGQSGYFGMKE